MRYLPSSHRVTVACLFLLLIAGSVAVKAGPATDLPNSVAAPAEPSALDKDSSGWIDLMPDADLHGWIRTPYPNKPLKMSNIWSVDAENKVLRCEGTGTHENLLFDKELGDGIFHVEWRFKKIEGAKGYNSGVFVRTSADGRIWHQAQVGNLNIGYLFGSTLKGDELVRFNIDDHVPQRGKEVGEWNTYEITAKGKTVSLWINGAVTATWTDCQVTQGLFGLEAEGWFIEFRNIKFKAVSQ